jgi:hypothetical protein
MKNLIILSLIWLTYFSGSVLSRAVVSETESAAEAISSPDMVEYTCHGVSLPGNGFYTKISDPGSSTCDCWNSQDNNRSIGRLGASSWRLFAGPNCPGQAGMHGVLIEENTTCDPTTLSCIQLPDIEYTCHGVSVNGQGIYTISPDKGMSDCDCWNHKDGQLSIGRLAGKRWYLFNFPNCPTRPGWSGGLIGESTSCDPTTLDCITQ